MQIRKQTHQHSRGYVNSGSTTMHRDHCASVKQRQTSWNTPADTKCCRRFQNKPANQRREDLSDASCGGRKERERAGKRERAAPPLPSSPLSLPPPPHTQHSTAQHSTTQHNTTQHNTTHITYAQPSQHTRTPHHNAHIIRDKIRNICYVCNFIRT